MQDVFQAVWQSAGSFQPSGNFSAWLIGIARHRAIDATRSRRHRARAREELLDDERVAGHGSAGDGGADVLMLRAVVRAALAELPASQRQAIELGYYGGLTHTEIAAQLGEPVGTVKSRMRHGADQAARAAEDDRGVGLDRPPVFEQRDDFQYKPDTPAERKQNENQVANRPNQRAQRNREEERHDADQS